MKRILILTLLLSLGLAGCAMTPPEEMPLEPPVLPTPAVPDTREFVADSSMETFSAEDDPVEPDESDVVTVHQESIPTRVENEARWDGFLAAAKRGEADAITLRLVYDRKDVFDLELRFDGEHYRLTNEGTVMSCKYLIVSEDAAPPPGAAYRRAVHYLISDDPEATWEVYFARIVSSSAPIGVEETPMCYLFSVYE